MAANWRRLFKFKRTVLVAVTSFHQMLKRDTKWIWLFVETNWMSYLPNLGRKYTRFWNRYNKITMKNMLNELEDVLNIEIL